MKDFNLSEIRAAQIALCIYVGAGQGDAVHRARPTHGLAYNVSGIKRYRFEKHGAFTVSGGEIIYLPRASDYTVETEEAGGCYAVNFHAMPESEPQAAPFVFKPQEGAPFLSLFKDAETMWRSKPEGYMAKCLSDLYGLLYRMQAQVSYQPAGRLARLAPAVEKIHASYVGELPDIALLAGLCGMSETYFRRLFSQRFGVSPVRYINDLRLERANELLGSGLYTVHDAAALSGFRDDSYFCRAYKNKYGTVPHAHRQAGST